MNEPSVSPVPVFLTKLWVLVEDPANCDVIAWNTNGQTFSILDEQRFTKEILPRYFKHSNLSSFIRQLNMYGFRKVMSLENGLVKSESAIEFQHPFFKKGRPELLEHIKRKVNSVKTEDSHLPQNNLQKVINELKVLQDGQSNMDFKLDTMRRENEILWKEVSSLRRKHSQQQKLLAKIFQFILSLMKGNILKGTNRKRPLTIEASQSSSPKYSRNMLQLSEGGVSEGNPSSQCPGSSTDNSLVIHEIPSAEERTFEHLPNQSPKSSLENLHDTQQVILMDETDVNLQLEVEESLYPSSSFLAQDQIVMPNASLPVADQSVIPSNSFVVENSFIHNSSTADEELALDLVQDSAPEDPDSVIDSILNENASASNINILDREEIQDFLNCIDASLEDLQTILCKNKFDVVSDFLEELFKPDLLSSDTTVTSENSGLNSGVTEVQKDIPMPSSEDLLNKGKQLVQYTGNPLLSLFDELPQSSYGEGGSDPVNLLNVVDNNVFSGNSVEQHVMKEADLAVDDYTGSHGFSPIFVLSPVSKLIEEATEPDTL